MFLCPYGFTLPGELLSIIQQKVFINNTFLYMDVMWLHNASGLLCSLIKLLKRSAKGSMFSHDKPPVNLLK